MNGVWRGSVILTIGYGKRSMDEFIALLKQFGVSYLIDVRSRPYSRYKPEFSRSQLEGQLKAEEIRYVFMGDLLGGMPDSNEFRDAEGKVDYVKLRTSNEFGVGIERLKRASAQGLTVALMCSEGDPRRCHRSHLIGVTLTEAKIEVMHIDESGHLISQIEALEEKIQGQLTLGLAVARDTSRKPHGGRNPRKQDGA